MTPAGLNTRPRLPALATGTLLLAVVCALALMAGARWLSPAHVWHALQGAGAGDDWLLLTRFRLPRMVGGLLIGALLAVSGGLLQTVTRNALADPGLLGLHAGAHVALITLLLNADPVTAGAWRVPVAVAGAGAAAAGVWGVSRRRGSTRPEVTLIVGIALGAALHAVGLMLAFSAPPDVLSRALAWTTGNLGEVAAGDATLLAVALAGVAAVAAALGRSLDALALGEEGAGSLGVPVAAVRGLAVAVAVLAAALCVAVGGAIASLGLLAPNLARRVVGGRTRPMLLLAACYGGVFLVGADLLGRCAFGAFEVPAGILIASVGTPYFLWLLVTR